MGQISEVAERFFLKYQPIAMKFRFSCHLEKICSYLRLKKQQILWGSKEKVFDSARVDFFFNL
jgi:hypothetical protein